MNEVNLTEVINTKFSQLTIDNFRLNLIRESFIIEIKSFYKIIIGFCSLFQKPNYITNPSY